MHKTSHNTYGKRQSPSVKSSTVGSRRLNRTITTKRKTVSNSARTSTSPCSPLVSRFSSAPAQLFVPSQPTVSMHSFDKAIPAGPALFAYLQQYGRRDLDAVNALRTDTLQKRAGIIRLMLEPTTCSFLEFKLREMNAKRVLEVGTFTGVTSMALALHIKQTMTHEPNLLTGLADDLHTSTLQAVRKMRESAALQYKKATQNGISQLDDAILTPPRSLDAPITVNDVMLCDSDRIIETLEQNHQQYKHSLKARLAHQQHGATSPPPPPPLVLTIDSNISNIEDVSLHHWEKNQLVGAPLVFLPGNAHKIIDRLSTSPEMAGTFDMIFVDADKKGYELYYEKGLKLLRQDGIMCVDNVLWKGHVVECAADEGTIQQELIDGIEFSRNFQSNNNNGDAPPDSIKENAQYLHQFNKLVQGDARVDMITLPIGDGLTLIRKL